MNPTSETNRHRHISKRVGTFIIAILCIAAAFFLILRDKPAPPAPATAPTSTTPSRSSSASQTPTAEAARQAETTADSLETLAEQDPSRALTLVSAEPDIDRYESLLQAVLRGWARTAPDAAANWALAQIRLDQGRAMAAIFNGANNNPANAVLLAQRLSTQHPEEAGSYGSYLIFSLAHVGQFELAANYAATSPDDIRTNLLAGAYTYWARQQPEQALHAATELTDPAKQDTAFHAVISGWSSLNPQTLTNAAYQFPEGLDRTVALTAGLRSWLEKDPAAAGEWMAQHKLTAKETERALEE